MGVSLPLLLLLLLAFVVFLYIRWFKTVRALQMWFWPGKGSRVEELMGMGVTEDDNVKENEEEAAIDWPLPSIKRGEDTV